MASQWEKFKQRYPSLVPTINASGLAPEFETKKSEFKEFYGTAYATLRAAEKTVRNLLELLSSQDDIATPKITSRVKDRDECIRKFEIKYRNDVERKGEDYKIQDYISDLIGIRVTCIYETDIEKVCDIIRNNFEVMAITDKTKMLVVDPDSFGYKGIHLDVKLDNHRRTFPEYKNFSDMNFEIQVRSIVQDAWSEVDHRLKYKKQIPDALKRRIYRLAALFELADQEFAAVRNLTVDLERAAEEAVTPSPEEENHPLNSFSFLSIMKSRYPLYHFDPIKVDGFVDEVKIMKPDLTIEEFLIALGNHAKVVEDWKEAMVESGFNINPFTEIRHVLYLHSSSIFDNMLYPRQRNEFLDWIRDRPAA
jgi:ppGpp synthetase/RelA/SpoT-type nucleotidyltranferase